jgi:hypothetical protein
MPNPASATPSLALAGDTVMILRGEQAMVLHRSNLSHNGACSTPTCTPSASPSHTPANPFIVASWTDSPGRSNESSSTVSKAMLPYSTASFFAALSSGPICVQIRPLVSFLQPLDLSTNTSAPAAHNDASSHIGRRRQPRLAGHFSTTAINKSLAGALIYIYYLLHMLTLTLPHPPPPSVRAARA